MKKILNLILITLSISIQAQLPYTQNSFAYDSLIDVVYGTEINYAGQNETLTMDIYKPIGDSNCLRPVMVLVHGGAWIGGSKNDVDLVYMSRSLAEKGWVVANINYRLGTHKAANYTMYALCSTSISQPCGYICDSSEIFRANFRGMQDAKGAIRFMKDREQSDSSDVNNFFIAGESAGGFIAFAAAFTDQASEKPADCFAIGDAPNPDQDLSAYGCIPTPISFARPDLGSIDGTLNLGLHDSKVKGIGNFFGGIFDLNMLNQVNDTPAVYLFHQGSDVVVNYVHDQVLGRTSWECYAQTSLCQSYYFYPWAYGSESIRQYFDTIISPPLHQSEIVNNYSYMNNCLSNGHSIDNIQLRLQTMVDFFAGKIDASGNDPGMNCEHIGVGEVDRENWILIYPNPFSESINLNINQKNIFSKFSITDETGRILLNGKISGAQFTIDTKELKSGFYILDIQGFRKKKIKIIKR